ncbi:hypothetical protein WT60_25675 [Burkholderia sp. MSMB617WGS]|nr:hypothetical protein WT60_25675 [Burkholderia sp. MSMB617WGS]
MRIMLCASCRAHHAVRIMPCASCRAHHAVRIMPCASCRAHHAVRIMPCASCRAHHAVRIMPCASCRAHHAVRAVARRDGAPMRIASTGTASIAARRSSRGNVERRTPSREPARPHKHRMNRLLSGRARSV